MLTRRRFHHLLFSAPAMRVSGQDWPQWRGPNRDGTAPSPGGPEIWPDKLTMRWKQDAGEGHSSPVVLGTRVFLFSRRGDREIVEARELESGKTVWQFGYAAPYQMNSAAYAHGKGPKSTPLIADGRLYTFGISGVLVCSDTATGKQLWRYDAAANWREGSPTFGVAMSPLSNGSDVIVHAGTDSNGALTAFDAATGRVRWQWKNDGPAYASPVIAKAAGITQLITFSAEHLFAVNAGNGALLWQIPFKTPYTQNSVTPLVIGDLIVYSGLSSPVSAIRITERRPQVVWENKDVSMYMSSPVTAAGLIHGLSQRNKGQFFSLNPQTGKTVWTSDGRQGENAMLVARGETVLALNTEGELLLMKASAAGLQSIRKYTVASSPTWAHPVLLGRRLLIKDKDSLALWTA